MERTRTLLPANVCPGRALRFPRLLLALLRLMLFVSGSCGVIALAAAEVEFCSDLPASVRHAAALGNSRYSERLVELESDRAGDVLQDALRADPLAAPLWIAWGLGEERRVEKWLRETSPGEKQRRTAPAEEGDHPWPREIADGSRSDDFHAAREAFETAFRIDRQYGPAWALANFCFRRGDERCFWRAASRAFARHPAWAAATTEGFASLTDFGPLFDLVSRMAPSAATALDRLTAVGSDQEIPVSEAENGIMPETSLRGGFLPVFSLLSTRPFSPGFGPSAATCSANPYTRPYATPDSVAGPLARAYLDYLVVKGRWEDAAEVAVRISSDFVRSSRIPCREPDASRRQAADRALLENIVDRLIAAGRVRAAVNLWNGFSGLRALDPDHGISLTNGDFAREPTNTGFDWRLGPESHGPGLEGPAATRARSSSSLSSSARSSSAGSSSDGFELRWTPSELAVHFTGDEAEQGELAEEWVPLASRRYRLRFEYEAEGLPSPPGILWECNSGKWRAEVSLTNPAPEWRSVRWDFDGAEGMASLRLVYRRALGTARARGVFRIRHVSLEVL